MLPRSAAAPPRPVRHRSSGLRTRAEIIAAAERHFAERGFEATRLDDVAAEVGIRRAAIFYHFGDKQELYAAVLDDVFGDWTAALPSEGGAGERLEAALASWIDYLARRPSVARMILREAAGFQPGRVSPFLHAGGAAIEWFRAVIEAGVASGELAPQQGPHRFLSLMGGITVFHGAGTPWLDASSRAGLDEHRRDVLRLARGLLGVRANEEGDER